MSDDPNKSSHLDRRDFIKTAGAGAGLILLGDAAGAEAAPARSAVVRSGASPDIVVIGAGIWGSFTAYHLRKMGANVTLVDAYGPGNARSTSGDETRGVRARRAVHAVAAAAEKLGGKIIIGRASPLKVTNGRLEAISLDTGTNLRDDTFVYAIGPWVGKTFTDLFAKKTRVPIGYVCY